MKKGGLCHRTSYPVVRQASKQVSELRRSYNRRGYYGFNYLTKSKVRVRERMKSPGDNGPAISCIHRQQS